MRFAIAVLSAGHELLIDGLHALAETALASLGPFRRLTGWWGPSGRSQTLTEAESVALRSEATGCTRVLWAPWPVTVDTVGDMIVIADSYRADHLLRYCFDLVSLNLAAVLENRCAPTPRPTWALARRPTAD